MKKKYSLALTMKNVIAVLLLSVLALPMAVQAEIKGGSFEVSPFIGINLFKKRQNLEDAPVYGGRFCYNITEHFGVEASGEFVQSHVDDKTAVFDKEGKFTSPTAGVSVTTYHLDLLYHLIAEGKFNPFVVAGYGAASYDPKINNKNMSIVDFGIGAKYWLSDNLALRADLRDNLVYEDNINNVQATVGIVVSFGGKTKKNRALSDASPAESAELADSTVPEIVFTSPSNGASKVSVNQKAYVAFSKEMNQSTLSRSTFTVMQGSSPIAGEVTSTDATATFTPDRNFERGKLYTVLVTDGAKDMSGNPLALSYEWRFTTGDVTDTMAPTVAFTTPVNGATAAPIKQKINVAFSEVMDPGTLNSKTFVVMQGGKSIPGKVTAAAANATFITNGDLANGMPYTATITTGAKDLAGNPLAQDYVWSFTSYAPPKALSTLVSLQNSHFDYNSSAISENGRTILDNNIVGLKNNPAMKLLVSGYTSASGTPEYNQGLSERRAEAVKAYLVTSGGIDAQRITTIGYGEAHPAQFEVDPSDRLSPAALANMRVVVEILEK